MCLAVPGKLLSITHTEPLFRTGRVSFGGIVKEVSLAYVPEAEVGDYVIVHVGFAISTLDEVEARKVFEYLEQMGELQELQDPNSESEPGHDKFFPSSGHPPTDLVGGNRRGFDDA